MYGSGAPLWGQSGKVSNANNNSAYQAPSYGNRNNDSYEQQQTKVVEDSLKTNYDAEGTAAAVLSQMTTQRYQLQSAHDDVWQMREATEKAKRELADMYAKSQAKKRKLQMVIAALAITDAILFFRLLKCGGSFIC